MRTMEHPDPDAGAVIRHTGSVDEAPLSLPPATSIPQGLRSRA